MVNYTFLFIKFILRVCVLFRRNRGAVCEKRLTFLYTSPCDLQVVNMSNITFGVPRLGRPTFVFKGTGPG